MVPLKRRRLTSLRTDRPGSEDVLKFPGVVIFLLERKMGGSRRVFLAQLGRSKGFHVEETFSQSVTHLVSENNSGDEVRTWLDSQEGEKGQEGDDVRRLLDISWYTESMSEGRPVEVLDRHRLQEKPDRREQLAVFSVPGYACQRRTPLRNQNPLLTDALSLLAESCEFSEEGGRALAFRRAVSVLQSLPTAVTSVEQLRGTACLGGHSLRVIKEVLEDGVSSEVEATRQSEQHRTMKVLTGIFGVGVRTADRWFRDGTRSLSQLHGAQLNRAQQAGLRHYDDLNLPVSRAEADAIGRIVEEAVHAVSPRAEVTLTGGFRRGKPTGHDVDFLITHPEEGEEEGLMPRVLSRLESQGFLLYQKTTKNSYLESKEGPARPASSMDRFERCFSIFRLARDRREGRTRGDKDSETRTLAQKNLHAAQETRLKAERSPESLAQSEGEAHAQGSHPHERTDPGPAPNRTTSPARGTQEERPEGDRTWRAVRVDLVVSPNSQFAFALLGWTGSKLFERDLRRWAGREKTMSLSSHALYDNTQGRYLRASTEEEIFAHLGLEFVPPGERNA